uniref:Uncharacterized protein n=1 Tax=viral metagenome TaxID=1070528 RepID=A0A6M3X6U7_9ZZZZ
MGSSGPEGNRAAAKRRGPERQIEALIVSSIEELISEGHSFGDIQNYSFPQLMLFVSLMTDRWTRRSEAMKAGGEAQKERKGKTSGRDRIALQKQRMKHGR